MKTLIISLLLITTTINAQKIKTEIHYKNGDSTIGYSKGIKYSFIKFSADKKEKYIKKDIKNIDKVILYYKEGKEEYHHIAVKKKKKVDNFFARLVSSGKINHYIYSSNFINSFTSFQKINLGNGTTINRTIQSNNNRSINLFYLKRKGDKYTTYMSDVYYSVFGEKIFTKNAINFFKNCDELVQKIKSKEFRKSDIIEIIEFYNEHCN